VNIHRFVVLADRVRGFDTLEAAEAYARANYPSVLCERRTEADGSSRLVEIARHDFLFDEEIGSFRIFLG
jgi:hypothetical protein